MSEIRRFARATKTFRGSCVIKDQTCCLTGVSADRKLPITGIRKGMQAELTSNSFFF